MKTAAEWFGLCARSESGTPLEWGALLTVMRNRLEGRGWPKTAAGVVLQPYQFSYFIPYVNRRDEEAIYAEAAQGYAGDASGNANDLRCAIHAAEAILAARREDLPFGANVFNFWSPVSMDGGKLPRWDWSELRCFTVRGIDPKRFIFAETVGRGNPGSGNVGDVVAGLGAK